MRHAVFRFEPKHRDLTAIARATASRKNLLVTVAIREQLAATSLHFKKYEEQYIEIGSEASINHANLYFPNAQQKKSLNYAVIDSVKFSPGTILLFDHDEFSEFGKIISVNFVDGDFFFEYQIYGYVGFNIHYFASIVMLYINITANW